MPIILDHKKVFISQPMNGIPDDEVWARREIAIDQLRNLIGDFEPLDSYIYESAPDDSNIPMWYFGKSIEVMARADIVAFAGDWRDARGCLLEHEIATKYGMTVIEL